jgi:hypothetical protein
VLDSSGRSNRAPEMVTPPGDALLKLNLDRVWMLVLGMLFNITVRRRGPKVLSDAKCALTSLDQF